MPHHPVAAHAAAALLLVTITLAACAPTAPPDAGEGAAPPSPTVAAEADDGGSTVTLEDAWAKAADTGMTGVFGTLRNATDHPVTLVGAESEIARAELHETTTDAAGATVMRPKPGGITLPAGGTHELAPGADHLMLLELTEPLLAGDEIELTLVADDGASWVVTVAVRTFTGADETYAPGAGQP